MQKKAYNLVKRINLKTLHFRHTLLKKSARAELIIFSYSFQFLIFVVLLHFFKNLSFELLTRSKGLKERKSC